ncbi:Bidirectional sugar transporter SWEET5 [Linum perenne]
MTFLNCCVWCVYGLPMVKPDSVLVLTINGFGFCLELVYISIFFVFSPWGKRQKKMIKFLLAEMLFFVVVVLITFLAFHTPPKRATFVGIICIIFNILMYVSPLTVMVPNGLGTIAALIQLILYGVFYRTTRWDEDDDVVLPPPPRTTAAGGAVDEFSEVQLSSRV